MCIYKQITPKNFLENLTFKKIFSVFIPLILKFKCSQIKLL